MSTVKNLIDELEEVYGKHPKLEICWEFLNFHGRYCSIERLFGGTEGSKKAVEYYEAVMEIPNILKDSHRFIINHKLRSYDYEAGDEDSGCFSTEEDCYLFSYLKHKNS
jgi:hypothetical protein